ncbi:MAG TPA: hypothetical protein VMG58_12070 [Candidatus Sulfotelmatobacter sp.]|nr:hypothetical protein [Candidatus Sulfotelmatobacter sp.]
MANIKRKAVARYRGRMKRKGFVRLEIQVRREDAPLLRSVAGALASAEQDEARALLRERFAPRETRGLKALLAAAPLEGVDLERIRDTGRAVEL